MKSNRGFNKLTSRRYRTTSLRIRVQSCAKATITENHAALPREVEVEARADAALIKGLPAPDGGKRHRRRGNQTEAVNRSGINALHWELRGQAALIVTGNHTREQQQQPVGKVRAQRFAAPTGDSERAVPSLRLSPERFCDDR
jgi:hypothetical protein